MLSMSSTFRTPKFSGRAFPLGDTWLMGERGVKLTATTQHHVRTVSGVSSLGKDPTQNVR